jgi:hypothetical protein
MRKVLGGFLALVLALGLYAGDQKKGVIESKDSLAHTTELLTKIPWHTTLDETLAAAKAEGKLVFWMHLKGRLDGAT